MTGKPPPASWFPSLGTGGAHAPAPEASSAKAPKLPIRIRRNIAASITNLEKWLRFNGIEATWKEALDHFRANRPHGVTNPRFVQMLKDQAGVLDALEKLDEAFHQAHSYRPEDDFSAGIVSVVSRYAKRGHISDERAQAERILVEYRYLDAPRGSAQTPGTKAWIKAKAVNRSGASSRTVDSIVRKLGQRD